MVCVGQMNLQISFCPEGKRCSWESERCPFDVIMAAITCPNSIHAGKSGNEKGWDRDDSGKMPARKGSFPGTFCL